MFLRRFERKKSGKVHTYWALVESYRTAKGSRQRIVAYVGGLKAGEHAGWASLGKRLPEFDKPKPSLFDPPPPEEIDEEVQVQLKGVRLEHLRDFGDVWLAWGLWRLLEFDTLLERIIPKGREDVPWAAVAAILVAARFCEPKSEAHIEHTWYRRTALPELLGVAVEQVKTDRLYGGLDRLLEHKETIEKHLEKRLGHLFGCKYDLLLYDVTSTYFEGDAENNPLAKRGYSRDSRPDRPQMCIGLVVTRDGLPLAHEVFAGNRHDSTTVQEIVRTMEEKYGKAGRIWVMDRGMVSEVNLKFLRARQASYIVGTPKAMLSRYAEQLELPGWEQVREGIEVKLVSSPEGDEVFLLTHSADRREKERAMVERFVTRMDQGLLKLQASASSGRLKTVAEAERRYGRMQQKNWRASKAFRVRIEALKEPQGKATICVQYERDPDWTKRVETTSGCYILRTNLVEMPATEVWRHYMQLVEAEWAFRTAKDELNLRPIWHQLENRARAHILVCFLAYAMWKVLSKWMEKSTLGTAPRTVVSEFAKIKSGDVVLPTRCADGSTGEVRLRCVTEPDAAQKVLLQRLGLKLPRRLRRIDPPSGPTPSP